MPHRSLPKIFLNNMGECDFNLDSLEYRGTPVEQARCLMRGVDQTRIYFMRAKLREKTRDLAGAKKDMAEGLRRIGIGLR